MNSLVRSMNLFKSAGFISRHFAIKPKREIEELLNKNKVVVFMKGVPEEPRCGFSNAVVQVLRMHGVPYDSHDVLKDDSLREGKI